jgi:hypothetical protein
MNYEFSELLEHCNFDEWRMSQSLKYPDHIIREALQYMKNSTSELDAGHLFILTCDRLCVEQRIRPDLLRHLEHADLNGLARPNYPGLSVCRGSTVKAMFNNMAQSIIKKYQG